MASNRVGWNARGGSTGYWLQQAFEQAARRDPDGYYWQNETQNIKLALIEQMGQDEFEQWAESVYPGDSIDAVTWEQICGTFARKFAELIHLDDDGRDWMDDPRHYKMES